MVVKGYIYFGEADLEELRNRLEAMREGKPIEDKEVIDDAIDLVEAVLDNKCHEEDGLDYDEY